jgi:hypothetical protein
MFEVRRCILYEGIVLEVEFEDNGALICFMADYERDGVIVRLKGLHAEGPASNMLGVSGLRLLAKEFMELLNAEQLEVHGGIRTTGSSPGRTPSPLTFRR